MTTGGWPGIGRQRSVVRGWERWLRDALGARDDNRPPDRTADFAWRFHHDDPAFLTAAERVLALHLSPPFRGAADSRVSPLDREILASRRARFREAVRADQDYYDTQVIRHRRWERQL